MLLARLRIRGKLAVLGAIPLLAVGGLTVPLVLGQVQLANRAAGTAGLVRAASGVGSLVQELQQERMLAAGYLAGVAEQADLVEQTARVGDRITDVRADLGGELPTETVAAVDALRDLGGLRARVLGHKVTPEQAVDGFTPAIAQLIASLHLGERQDLSAPGGSEVVALDAVLRLGEQINIAAADIMIAAATGSLATGEQLGATLATIQVISERVQTYATPEQAALSTLLQQSFDLRAGGNFITGYPVDPANPVETAARQSAPTLFPALLSFTTLNRFVERKIAVEATTAVAAQQRRALAFAYGAGAISLLVLILVVLLTVAVASAVARPLTRLTRSVERVARTAEEELERVADDETEVAAPVHLAPVAIQAKDEVGDLARAFEGVQQTAARLVERQAASRRNVAQMFGHVGRRTQNLVGRQITLIDQLEQGEEDPSRLQYLYRLDHLSSRLRRNAGSLVVLSGAQGAEPHVEPMRLGDVVRLALGEIEDYTRVDISVPDDLVLVPALVGDMVLVLAELMENATNFSPPHTRVSVRASGPGGSTSVQLAIVDHGLGMSPERLAEENARLGRRERLDLAPTEVLGLFVVGRLARRHGLGVMLDATPGGGVTATVDLARHMLVPGAQLRVASALPALSGRRQDDLPARQAIGSAPHTWPTRVVALAGTDMPYDVAVLDHAQRTLAAGPTWNAFAIEPATKDSPVRPRQALRQRVRGAHLPTAPSRQPAGPAGPTGDPEAARGLVEDFEAGVRRALTGASDHAIMDGAHEAPAADLPATPAVEPLVRRVPGATLRPPSAPSAAPSTASDSEQPIGNRPADPQQARELIEQFEAGVLRAMRESGSDHRDEPDHRHEEEQPP